MRPFAVINAGESCVLMQFGKVQDRVLDEGLHPIIPIVISVKRINVRVQKKIFSNPMQLLKTCKQLPQNLQLTGTLTH